jgi:ribosomal subunit interface protein
VEMDRQTNQKTGEVYHVRINVAVPHQLLHAEEMRHDIYAAIDVCKDEVEQQIRKYKDHFAGTQRKAQRTRRTLKNFFGLQRLTNKPE